MVTISLSRISTATVIAAALSLGPALAQQGPPGCNWKKYLYARCRAARQARYQHA